MDSLLHDRTTDDSPSARLSSGSVSTKTLLVPLDGTDDGMRSLPIAARLASAVDADIVLVAAELPGSSGPSSETWLENAAATLGPRAARIETVSSVNVSSALEALAAAEVEPVVCMATHARAPIGRAWFGSVAEAVLRGLTYPIVLVGPAVTRAGGLVGRSSPRSTDRRPRSRLSVQRSSGAEHSESESQRFTSPTRSTPTSFPMRCSKQQRSSTRTQI
jgi:nucleotide-binding universal stress UspA family protein